MVSAAMYRESTTHESQKDPSGNPEPEAPAKSAQGAGTTPAEREEERKRLLWENW
jgi:hypothetical protein